MNKLIVILGPTASGKTSLSIKLARRFHGAVVSADSRQVYKGMNLGAGKITKKEMQGIPHYLLDVVSPKKRFSVSAYQKMAYQAIGKIIKDNKIPFLVGGSPFYLYSIIDGWQFPNIKANLRFRNQLNKKTAEQLMVMLKKLDSQRANQVDPYNKRRIIRAIELAKEFGKVPAIQKSPKFNCLILGVKKEGEELRQAIKKRLLKRFEQGMAQEVKKLHQSSVSWKKLESFGLEYKWIAQYLQNKITYQEMLHNLERDIWRFSKQQMTWFKKDPRIIWVKNQKQAEKLILSLRANRSERGNLVV